MMVIKLNKVLMSDPAANLQHTTIHIDCGMHRTSMTQHMQRSQTGFTIAATKYIDDQCLHDSLFRQLADKLQSARLS